MLLLYPGELYRLLGASSFYYDWNKIQKFVLKFIYALFWKWEKLHIHVCAFWLYHTMIRKIFMCDISEK